MSVDNTLMKTIHLLEGLSCSHCANKMEAAIEKIEGVKSVTVNFISQRLVIEFDETRQGEILSKAERIVKSTEPNVEMKLLLASRKK